MTNLKKWTAVALVMIVSLSSCEVKEIHEDYTDPIYSLTKNYSVFQRNWNVGRDDNSGIYYYCEFAEPDLTRYIYENGSMQAFLYVSGENISPLPFNDYWVNDHTGYMSTEQITCEFCPGYVTFIVKASDHNENFLPSYDEYDFMVRFMW